MLKKIVCIFLIIVLLIPSYCIASNMPVWNDVVITSTLPDKTEKIDLNVLSESCILIDEETGTILYSKNEHEKLRPASVTKVMTLLLIMEALDSR